MVLWVCALYELIDTEDIDHEFERLSVPRKVLLSSNKSHFLSELEPDKGNCKNDAGHNQESESSNSQRSIG